MPAISQQKLLVTPWLFNRSELETGANWKITFLIGKSSHHPNMGHVP
jgi:hypothetical protein